MISEAGKRQVVFAGLALQVVAATAIACCSSGVIADLNPGARSLVVGALAGASLYAALSARLPARVRVGDAKALRRFALLSAAFICIGTSEEIIWRGFAFDAMLRHGVVAALFFTTIGFAVMHAFGQAAAGLRTHIVTGFVFGLLRLLTGSLTASIVAHIIYNEMVLLQRMHGHPERRTVKC